MPIITVKGLPAAATLKREGVAVWDVCPAGLRPLRVLFLNLMPQKEQTELDILRSLSHAALPVEVVPVKIAGQTYKTTPMEHMQAFYTDIEKLMGGTFDGLVVTGAPVEHLAFEDVRYWPQLCTIMDWARTHVRSTLYICWGAQAALYHHYGIPKYALPEKMFGIFPQRVLSAVPLFDGMERPFPMPNSRHTEVRVADFPAGADVEPVAVSDESGMGVAVGAGGREIYVAGHLEYEPATLEREYRRDVAKGLPIALPRHYYHGDDPAQGIDYSWQRACATFYANWVERYVAPQTASPSV